MSLAAYVRLMGRGQARARSLTRAEAADAMGQILDGSAAPEAVGALLMLMRYRGESPEEIAGFTDALRVGLQAWRTLPVALDWPSYAAGRSRGLPWFLLAAKLVANPAHPVLIHGWNSHQGALADVRRAVAELDIPVVHEPGQARAALSEHGIAYLPLESFHERALAVLRLREVLGLRSAVNTALRMFNPCGADAAVQGVFHPPYLALQQAAGAVLGQRRQVIIKGGGGEFERHPGKAVAVHGLLDGARFETRTEPMSAYVGRLADIADKRSRMMGLWEETWQSPEAEAVILGTAALALLAMGRASGLQESESLAGVLWRQRHGAQTAYPARIAS